jgi:hypothetical protein
MYTVTEESLRKAYKPLDIVSDKHGNVGMIQEVSVNNCQESFDWQISYSVTWLTGSERKVAWFHHDELQRHCNLMLKIAENMCHPMGNNARKVESLFKHL